MVLLVNVRTKKVLYEFSFANMEILLTHSLLGETAATSGGVRKLPYGNNDSHKKWNSHFLSEKKKRQAGPSSGPELMASLWSHLQKDRDEDTVRLTLPDSESR